MSKLDRSIDYACVPCRECAPYRSHHWIVWNVVDVLQELLTQRGVSAVLAAQKNHGIIWLCRHCRAWLQADTDFVNSRPGFEVVQRLFNSIARPIIRKRSVDYVHAPCSECRADDPSQSQHHWMLSNSHEVEACDPTYLGDDAMDASRKSMLLWTCKHCRAWMEVKPTDSEYETDAQTQFELSGLGMHVDADPKKSNGRH